MSKTARPEGTILPKIWITKYALTTGVMTAEKVELCNPPTMIQIRGKYPAYFHKPDWCESEAKAQVLKMIASKRKSVAKSLEKLDELVSSLDGGIATIPFIQE